MDKPITWSKPDGSWGIEGVDLAALPPKVYGALCKLRDLEHPICPDVEQTPCPAWAAHIKARFEGSE